MNTITNIKYETAAELLKKHKDEIKAFAKSQRQVDDEINERFFQKDYTSVLAELRIGNPNTFFYCLSGYSVIRFRELGFKVDEHKQPNGSMSVYYVKLIH